MITRILPHLTLCEAADRYILLDIRQDRYLAIPPPLTTSMRQWLGDTGAPLPKQLRDVLHRAGSLAANDSEPLVSTERVAALVPQDMRLSASSPDPSVGTTAVLFAVASTAIRLRLQTLQNILADHARRRVYESKTPNIDIAARVAAFERARRFVPIARNCLLDTLSLETWLGHGAFECRVVFGVTALPFAAHCWLQRGSAVLNDSLDRVSRYTPILTI